LVNRNGFSIHHTANSARFFELPFIFDERRAGMVNRQCVTASARFISIACVNPMLNRIRLELDE
jgi:hypothetical protein